MNLTHNSSPTRKSLFICWESYNPLEKIGKIWTLARDKNLIVRWWTNAEAVAKQFFKNMIILS